VKLSEKLDKAWHSLYYDGDEHGICEILWEAEILAKRYEDAPVAAFFWGDPSELVLAIEHLSGQRVRILLDTEGV
jgi:hypothetical protein